MLIHQRKFVEKPSPIQQVHITNTHFFFKFHKNKKQKKQLLIHNGQSMKVPIDSTLYEKKIHIFIVYRQCQLCARFGLIAIFLTAELAEIFKCIFTFDN